jgi:hypothetical protein
MRTVSMSAAKKAVRKPKTEISSQTGGENEETESRNQKSGSRKSAAPPWRPSVKLERVSECGLRTAKGQLPRFPFYRDLGNYPPEKKKAAASSSRLCGNPELYSRPRNPFAFAEEPINRSLFR